MNLTLNILLITGCDGPVPTRAEIVTKYPNVENGSTRPENTEILCPFVRMLERSGLFDQEVQSQPTMSVSVNHEYLPLGIANQTSGRFYVMK